MATVAKSSLRGRPSIVALAFEGLRAEQAKAARKKPADDAEEAPTGRIPAAPFKRTPHEMRKTKMPLPPNLARGLAKAVKKAAKKKVVKK